MEHRLGLIIGGAAVASVATTVTILRRCGVLAGLTAAATVGTGALADSATVAGQLYVSGLSRPVEMIQDPANDNVQFVVEQSGRIRVIVDGVLTLPDLVNIAGTIGSTANERGLLGLAIPPQGVGRSDEDSIYINHTRFPGGINPDNETVIARYQRTAPGALTVDVNSRIEILTIDQDFANHNGGHITFGPDGMLYIGMGDGGSGGDPNNRAQSINVLLGKLLRIDVEVSDPVNDTYLIPADNPFLGAGGALAGTLPEIFALGVRNPWKYNFDSFGCAATNAMLMADVGQDLWEEVDYLSGDYDPSVAADRLNFGWRHREGMHDFNTSIPSPLPNFVEPIHEYSHGTGFSITGGYVYRGAAMPQNRGRYFFADFVNSHVWSMDVSGGVASDLREHVSEIFSGGLFFNGVSAFAQDADGELYVINYGVGQIIKIVPTLTTGDLNGDGAVDTADLGIMLNLFGNSERLDADLNNDCVTDTADLGILLGNFGN
ncbi:MAG: PQQ-dependent sugar dehydrogenase [Phycisphaeraceae bacterium]|nr:PQQ-dependent sugar dehydrogenase [Phycisphaeraceae bacterium]MCB9847370.1 PQQ-dependent sugar dehydrogenase [Phycisphaeraceae bacterium]